MSRPRDAAAGPSGILVLVKPPGPTSHDMVALVRRLAGTRKVGHGGTLDPFASGVLPLFLGRATRIAEYHLGDRKSYRATVCFGASSTTDDLEGELTPGGSAPDRAIVESGLAAFRGEIEQTPPSYSAIKVAGRRAYALARAGVTPELKPRPVTIHRLTLTGWDGTDPERPIATLEVDCSAGTYVRSLARDVGAAVGSAAYLGALVRTASGPFTIELAHGVDALREAAAVGPTRLARLIVSPETGLDRFPRVALTADEVRAVSLGQFIRPLDRIAAPDDPETRYRLVDRGGGLIAIAALRDGRLAPEKVLVDAAPSGGDGADHPTGNEGASVDDD